MGLESQWVSGASHLTAPFDSVCWQDHCLLLNGGRTAMRREPQDGPEDSEEGGELAAGHEQRRSGS